MKKFLWASAVCLFPVAQAMAETITIDGVVDETPGKSFSAAGGELAIRFQSGTSYAESVTIIGDSKNPHKSSDLDANFGDQTIIVYTTDFDKRKKLGANIDAKSTRMSLKISSANEIAVTIPKIREEIINRDPNRTLDQRYTIKVTEWTPGKNGHRGKAMIVLKRLETNPPSK